MKNFFKNCALGVKNSVPNLLRNFALIIAGVLLAVGLNIVAYAFDEPALSPPQCTAGSPGCDAPINVGPADQIKKGSLTISDGSLSVGKGVGVGGVLTSKIDSFFAMDSGKVGIGTTTAPTAKLGITADMDKLIGLTRKGTIDTSYSFNVGTDGKFVIKNTAGNPLLAISEPLAHTSANPLAVCVDKYGGLMLCPPPLISLAITPIIIGTGQAATITWEVYDAISCSASGNWSGVKASFGSEIKTLESNPGSDLNYNFTLTCNNKAGSSSKTVSVNVKSYKITTGYGNFGESCKNWLIRTGQQGVNNSQVNSYSGWSGWHNGICVYRSTLGGWSYEAPSFTNSGWRPVAQSNCDAGYGCNIYTAR